jgi:hypothetical protein
VNADIEAQALAPTASPAVERIWGSIDVHLEPAFICGLLAILGWFFVVDHADLLTTPWVILWLGATVVTCALTIFAVIFGYDLSLYLDGRPTLILDADGVEWIGGRVSWREVQRVWIRRESGEHGPTWHLVVSFFPGINVAPTEYVWRGRATYGWKGRATFGRLSEAPPTIDTRLGNEKDARAALTKFRPFLGDLVVSEDVEEN